MNFLTTAEQLKNELDTLRPLDKEAEARIMQKFRLDWNYHSNNLEGNSLTYGETKALILFGITAQGKPLKDHFEITGHNEAINWILEIVKDKTPLTEKFIRELHLLLLKEASYKEAQTPNGKPTRRRIEVGKYKTLPNHVVTVTGETFYFATPEETSAKMQELIEWFRKEKEKSDVNPIILAALFHYRFIRIHPFDDGNGRVARILMNFILMQFGYPPVIIKTEDKENYYAVLRLADADELEPFIEYITENLIRSLEIMIRGARGENIEELDDLDKELALLEGKLKGLGRKVDLVKTPDLVLDVIDESIIFLISDFIKSCKKFDKFYVKNQFLVYANPYRKAWQMDGEFTTERIEEFREALWTYINLEYFSYVKLSYEYLTFNRENVGDFDYSSNIYLDFGKTHYRIKSEYQKKSEKGIFLEKLYSEQITEDEIQKIVKFKAKQHKDFIERKLEEKKIKLSSF